MCKNLFILRAEINNSFSNSKFLISMKKYFAILAIAMVAFACAGKQETKAPEAAPATEEVAPAVNDSVSVAPAATDSVATTTPVAQ
jgi:PBP1b-binding outer membrane lipoprotein LpoB